ncbi:serine/threonine protein kinase [Amphritea balenae]|uniref:Stress response kinase A n=1 Tax=Amphritea balenae TaxID=452629 RepID=A0A3P1SUY8_9GAMM|nr:serine/threonine protein kinase [Amphritea balenae]RRD00376.1 serine/threonine protein kinase [Amphritea balenae]GGK85956.1 stress response kinase A [Amphritea balenae]
MSDNQHPFETLTPSFIQDAIESLDYLCDGRVFGLNSYENRVYQIGIEEQQPLIAKFYRPARWTREQILEEHQFCFELQEQELPVVAPMTDARGESLFQYGDFMFSLFERKGGHAPELDNLDNLLILGRLLGRIHLIGAQRPFTTRPMIDIQSYGRSSVELISAKFIPAELKTAYDSLAFDLLEHMERIWQETGTLNQIRVHGDCHIGNMLWRDDAPHFVDFDDARMAPAIQDIWMLLSGDRDRQQAQLLEIIEGYNEFYDFNPTELRLAETLRTLRMMNYAAWIARRWEDPAFPHNFPWFNTVRYWSEHILELREQLAALQEAPLQLYN